MAKVQRANVILTVPDSDIEHYLDKGYSQIDEEGKVIKSATPNTYDSLLKEYTRLKAEYEKLKDEAEVFKRVAEKTEADEKPESKKRKRNNE